MKDWTGLIKIVYKNIFSIFVLRTLVQVKELHLSASKHECMGCKMLYFSRVKTTEGLI